MGQFPTTRLRRHRRVEWLRELVAETILSSNDLIWPLFVREEALSPTIKGMPGVTRFTIPELIEAAGKAQEVGIKALALFPVIPHEKRCDQAAEALNPENILLQAIRALKKTYPQLGIISDPALDSFTSHGHDGLIIKGEIANDETVQALCQHALLQAEAGADIVAPSDMMDGRIGAIRRSLDTHGYQDVAIMSYAAKYASAFYSPFREALGSDHCLGTKDKKTYQMDPANAREALREVALDISEGADSIMIKPGLAYLDIIHQVKHKFMVPTFAFHVSGEYAMLKVAAAQGVIEYEKTLLEIMISFKRAGADGILTYGAYDIANMLKK
ncbi:MAG: porphobilinogen synthase [Candidatus Paracaedimonas acanthamoebae]|uniref:Delta-aminolevulinic acid dehydratase n=1 Tax=Candidatus Paracaedimonas acanthamoebae TaxID=244581 RepID=A0A8J7PK91_9PROT|nr:porphobilinogen synthase [Candidatus Paracaedimonas acanthamoebae]